MKQYICLLVVLFLVGCDASPFSGDEKNTEKFKIGATVFQYTLPNDWIKTESESKKGEILLAQKNNENFVIIQRYSNPDNLADELFQQAKKGFFFFKTLNFSKTEWSFRGKVSSTTPLREFHQKIFPIKNTDIFIYGSCSYEFSEEKQSDCEGIINSWEILVDKK